ncbi:MAG TPA: pepsin/retropepsin-like aspartic protease family protein [Candidatus Acidoferrum sp.]|jgi:predicted aspartyl protease|nr:pepsin/retropepsin-like aspartic protease family protein [Candidatus Acidoferrum sp.]
MKKPMEVRGGAVLLLALLFIPFSVSGAQGNRDATENGPDLELKEFRLDELEARLRTMEPGPERDYFAGVLANRTGHIEESIQLLNGVLPVVRGSRRDRAEIALEALADGYTKKFRYADAARAYDDLLAHFPDQLKGEKLQHTEDDAKLAQILRDAPAQTLSWNGATNLKTVRNPLNSWNVELTVNGVRGPWLLDTGANFSVVTKSFAERLGLKLLEGASQTQAGITGIENPLRVALLPTLEMGGATLHNVVVLVLEDANLKISLGKESYQINGIIGYPVFQALGTVTFLHDGEFEAGHPIQATGKGARMFMKELTPIIQCEVEGKDLPFSLDTGASDTDLFVRYLERFQNESKTWKKGRAMSAGAGGVVKLKIYIQPELKLGIGDKVVVLKKVTVHRSSTGTDIAELYGNLGQDVVANFESFTLDFLGMTFRLGEPLPAGEVH